MYQWDPTLTAPPTVRRVISSCTEETSHPATPSSFSGNIGGKKNGKVSIRREFNQSPHRPNDHRGCAYVWSPTRAPTTFGGRARRRWTGKGFRTRGRGIEPQILDCSRQGLRCARPW